jgi:8-oxo-dGTP pyrophosphatase MutT (NUDIX family)
VEDGEVLPWMAAALRELVEEVGIWITTEPMSETPTERPFGADVYAALGKGGSRFDAARLAYFANWITPTIIPVRFDTRFFAAVADDGMVADPDPSELARARWIDAAAAMDLAAAGEWTVPFPTVKTLEFLSRFAAASEVLDAARASEIQTVLPRARVGGDGAVEVVLPGEPGYEALGDNEPAPQVLSSAGRTGFAATRSAELGDDES